MEITIQDFLKHPFFWVCMATWITSVVVIWMSYTDTQQRLLYEIDKLKAVIKALEGQNKTDLHHYHYKKDEL